MLRYLIVDTDVESIGGLYWGATYLPFTDINLELLGENVKLTDECDKVELIAENDSVFEIEKNGEVWHYGRVTIYKITPRGVFVNTKKIDIKHPKGDNWSDGLAGFGDKIYTFYEKLRVEYHTLLLCLKALKYKMPQPLRHHFHG